MQFQIRIAMQCVLLALLPSIVAPGAAHGAVERRVLGPNDEATGLVIVSPFRIEEDVEPGVRETITMTLTNDSDEEVDITVTPTDLEAAADPRNFVEQVEDGEFGAGDWLVPEIVNDRMQPWERLEFELVIDPPLDAPVGTNLAGLSIDTAIAEGAPGTEDQRSGVLRAEALVQVFLTIPGPVKHDLRVIDIDVRDTLVLGSQRFVVWDVTYRNAGTVNEHVSGTFEVRSIFGNAAYRQRVTESLVLRGSTRTERIVWRDLPWVGAFTPHLRVRGDDAGLIRASGERVVVFPWWLPIAILLLLLAPAMWLWWRRRQEWKLYLDDDTWDDEAAWDDDDARLPGV